MNNKFTEEDKEKVIKFLNMVASKGTFNLNTNEIISYFSLLKYMQQELLPKINSNILEVVEVIESNEGVEEDV